MREFRSLYNKTEKLEYIIWANEENLRRIRLSHYLFIDGTFHHPIEFKQLLIIMYHDIVSDLNIPGIYILINGKSEKFYDIAFQSVIDIITDYDKININIDTIVTDSELALIKIIKNIFQIL